MKEFKTIDRSDWESGPWDAEPDKVHWIDPITNLDCLAVREPHNGHWCGYVGVPEGHKYFKVIYHQVNVCPHGGLTYSDFCQPGVEEGRGICHVPEVGRPDHIWWLGFDCNHSWDKGVTKKSGEDQFYYRTGHYKTLAFVKRNCSKLALELENRDAEEVDKV